MSHKVKVSDSLEELEDYIKGIEKENPVFFDVETQGLYGKIRLVQMYEKSTGVVFCLDLIGGGEITEENLRVKLLGLVEIISPLHLVGHNIVYDISTLQILLGREFFSVKEISDTLLLSRLAWVGEASYSLDKCIELAIKKDVYECFGNKKELQKFSWKGELTKKHITYAATDVVYLAELYDKVKRFEKSTSYKLDINSLKNSLQFQCNGVPVNTEKLLQLKQELLEEKKSIVLPINHNSYKQVPKYLGFEDGEGSSKLVLSHHAFKGTKENATEFEVWRGKECEKIKNLRKFDKLIQFIDKFIASSLRGRVFGVFSPTAVSGRYVCKNMNLQQIPKLLNKCIEVSGDEFVFVYSDFSQLELFCVAGISLDVGMCNALINGEDLHTKTAKAIFDSEDIDKKQRSIAKTGNFGLLYGAGVKAFRDMLLTTTGILLSYEESVNVVNKWRSTWKGIHDWQKEGIKKFNFGEVGRTALGRVYKAKMLTDYLNIQVQGTGSEVAKYANHLMTKKLSELALVDEDFKDWKKWQVNFVHDSFLFVCKNEERVYSKLAEIIAESMQESWEMVKKFFKGLGKTLSIPVNVLIGKNLYDLDNGVNIIKSVNK